jgi:hypothetical protein
MDISKLSHGAKLLLGATIAFLIVSIFNWQEVEFAGIAAAGVSMWDGWGVLAGLLAVGILAWEGLRLANMKVEIGLSPAMVTSGLAILLGLFTLLKFLVDNEFRTFWAWLGLILAIAIVVSAVMNMQASGESIGDMKTSMVAAAGGAAAAARGAVESATDKAGDGKDAPTGTTGAATDAGAGTVDTPDAPEGTSGGDEPSQTS